MTTFASVPAPAADVARLAALQQFDFLRDSLAEPAFRTAVDGVLGIACDVLGRGKAVVSLVFESDQLFVGRVDGRDERSTGEMAFAAQAVRCDDPLVVQDASRDARFCDNRFVTGPERVRFYAGVPLEWAPGIRLGVLAVYDDRPGLLAPHEARTLRKLAAIVTDKLRSLLNERALRAQRAVLRQTEALAHVGTWEIDVLAQQLVWSEQMYRIHGMAPGSELTLEMTQTLYATEAGVEASRHYEEVRASGGKFELNVSFFTAQGELRHGIMVGESDAGGRRLFGSLRDVTTEHTDKAKITAASLYDPLTALPNRVLFEQRLAELEDTEGGALVVVGLDDLQTINDARGREVGNRILREAAYRLVAAVGSANVVARLGDHEFAIYVAEASGPKLGEYEHALRHAFDEPFQGPDGAVSTTASLGFATVARARDAVVALSGAEIALHHARRQGPHAVAHFAPELREERKRAADLLDDIRRGIANREFILHYQPICAVDGTGRGFEALMRWNHPVHGLLAPYHFLAGFADPELSVALGDVALREALGQMRAWRNQGLDFGYVAVNVATAQFDKPDFVGEVVSLLRVQGIKPAWLVLEVTETVYLDASSERIASVLRAFRSAGISLALDDFGTGHASLTHLRQFPIDKIKIDQTFIRELEKNPGDAEIVKAMVSLGKSLGMHVVAEGVETAAQLAFLTALGCDLIQGYYFSRPQAAADVSHFCAPLQPACRGTEDALPHSERALRHMPSSALRTELRRALWNR